MFTKPCFIALLTKMWNGQCRRRTERAIHTKETYFYLIRYEKRTHLDSFNRPVGLLIRQISIKCKGIARLVTRWVQTTFIICQLILFRKAH